MDFSIRQCCVVCGTIKDASLSKDICFFRYVCASIFLYNSFQCSSLYNRASDIVKKVWLMDLLAILKKYGKEQLAVFKEESEQFITNEDLICSRHFEGVLFQ